MINILRFLKKHSLLSFYILAFALSWTAILIDCFVNGLPATQTELDARLMVAIFSMLGGPSVAGLVMIAVQSGRHGLADLGASLRTWRINPGWYALAFLAGPLVLLTVGLLLGLFSPVYLPKILSADDPSALLIMGISAGLITGLCEEIGWSGFAIPNLRKQNGIFRTGLIAGILWGAWHILSNDIWAIHTIAGSISPVWFAIMNGLCLLLGHLVPFRILMVRLYEATHSLLVVVLMHAGLTISTLIFGPKSITGVDLFIYNLALTVLMWIAVLAFRRLPINSSSNR